MIRHRCGLGLAVCVGLGWGIAGALPLSQPAYGQTARPQVTPRPPAAQPAPAGAAAAFPAAARSATNVAPYVAEIEAFIADRLARMYGEDIAAQAKARQDLTDVVQPINNQPAGAVFLQQYSKSLDKAISDMPAGISPRAKLNAAITVARVAAVADNAYLAGATIKLMTDESMPVALWGLKAAKFVLPPELRNPLGNSRLLPVIRQTVEKHPKSGAIYEDAYEALSLQLLSNPAVLQPAMVPAVVPVVQDLLAGRVEELTRGPIDQPHAETRATFFLSHPQVFNVAAAGNGAGGNGAATDVKLRSIQLITDFINVAAQRAAADPNEKPVLVPAIRQAAGAMQAIGGLTNSAQVTAAARAVAEVQDNTPVAQITQSAAKLHEVLAAVPAFSGLKPFPQVQASEGENPAAPAVADGAPVQP